MQRSAFEPVPIPRRRPRRHPDGPGAPEATGERGIALILALLVLAILIVLVAQFAWSAKVEKTIAKNAKDEMKMLFAARGAVSYARAWLRADRAAGGKADSLREDWAEATAQSLQVGDVSLQVSMEDSERYLNVNLCYDGQGQRDWVVGVLTRLATRLQVEDEKGAQLAERIADFIDSDSTGQYESGARNLPLIHAEELLGMPGVDRSRAGFDEGLYLALVGQPADPYAGTEPVRGVLEFLTASGSKKLNINTCPLDLFWAVLPEKNTQGQEIDRDAAIGKIDEWRTGVDSTSGSTGSSASSGSSTIGPGTGDAASGDGSEKPGKDFNSVDELQQVEGLANILPPAQQQGGQGGNNPPGGSAGGTTGASAASSTGASAGEAQPPSLRTLLAVVSQDFRLFIDASRAGMSKSYEVVLRRGREQFDVILWRERPQAAAPAAALGAGS
jgi:type II secretory pathway component PulK